MALTDDQATRAVEAAVALAVALRDEGPQEVQRLARDVIRHAAGDPVAAVALVAALVNLDAPLNAWWTPSEPAPRPAGRPLKPCGTNAAWMRHKRNQEPIDDACRAAHAADERDRHSHGEAVA